MMNWNIGRVYLIRINLQRQLFGIFKSLICSRFLATEGLYRGVHRNLSREGEAHIFLLSMGLLSTFWGLETIDFTDPEGIIPIAPLPLCTPLSVFHSYSGLHILNIHAGRQNSTFRSLRYKEIRSSLKSHPLWRTNCHF